MGALDIHSALDAHISSVLAPDTRPNILLLFTDQQRADTIGALGNPHMVTPNLDQLVREGRAYTNAYSPNPICCPARHNLITGLPARDHGIADNEFEARCNRCLPTIHALSAKCISNRPVAITASKSWNRWRKCPPI
jgi:arylsulfatase A-like enzyme